VLSDLVLIHPRCFIRLASGNSYGCSFAAQPILKPAGCALPAAQCWRSSFSAGKSRSQIELLFRVLQLPLSFAQSNSRQLGLKLAQHQ